MLGRGWSIRHDFTSPKRGAKRHNGTRWRYSLVNGDRRRKLRDKTFIALRDRGSIARIESHVSHDVWSLPVEPERIDWSGSFGAFK